MPNFGRTRIANRRGIATLFSALILMAGLVALLGGGEVLVRGATSLARAAGVSPLMVGMTVVAFGTSAPELGVNITAALNGAGAISFGNVVGSSLANIGLILGAAALIKPLQVGVSTIARELPIMVAATALMIPLGLDATYGRIDGVILLIAFCGFVAFAVGSAIRSRRERSSQCPEGEDGEKEKNLPTVLALAMTVGGIAGVLLGSGWTVDGAVGIARTIGVSEAVIGLTIVAIGTSLPELATSLVAVRAGEANLAIGNVVGSNLFNILFVCGVTTTIRPIDLPPSGGVDLTALIAMSLALWLMAATHERRLLRWEGAVLLVFYLAYMAWRSLVSPE